MHAYLSLALAIAAPALAAALPAPAAEPAGAPARLGYEREIPATRYNQVPKLQNYVLSDEYLANQKNRAKLITKPLPEDLLAADNVILESNVVTILRPVKKVDSDSGVELVRRRRGFNLEHVRVPAKYPYLAVPSYYRYRRWG